MHPPDNYNWMNIKKFLLQHSVTTLGDFFWPFYMQWYMWSSHEWLGRFLSTKVWRGVWYMGTNTLKEPLLCYPEVWGNTSPTLLLLFIVVPCCMLFQPLLYCCNSCTSLHFKTLKSHTKTLKILPYMFWSSLKPSSGGPWLYFTTLLNWNVDLHLL